MASQPVCARAADRGGLLRRDAVLARSDDDDIWRTVDAGGRIRGGDPRRVPVAVSRSLRMDPVAAVSLARGGRGADRAVGGGGHGKGRTYLWDGFPWELLGYSQVTVLPIAQLASIVGVYGLSGFV